MSVFDKATEQDFDLMLTPAVLSATGTSAAVDTKDAGSVTIVIFTGAISAADADNRVQPKVIGSAASDLSSPTDIPADDLIVNGVPGAAIPAINNTNLADGVLCKIAYRGHGFRYLGVVNTETGTFSGIVGVLAVREHLGMQPVGAI